MAEIPSELWRYEEDLQRFARFLCRHPEDAEDIAHNALLKAAEHSDDFRGQASMRTWLHTIVTNECRMLRRRKTSVSLDGGFERTDQGLMATGLAGDLPDPGTVAEESELRRLALATLGDMPEHYRTALFLQVAMRQSTEEVAQALGKTISATKSILYRARASMREEIAPYLDREVEAG